MKLSQLLRPELVALPLRAGDKWDAIRQLAAVGAASGAIPATLLEGVEQALVTRERSMTTGMEHGIAIPHAAVEGLDDVVAILGLSDGIPFESLDGKDARIVVCLVIPRAKKLLHIKTLAEIAKLLSREAVRGRLLECASSDEVLACLRDSESA